MSVTLRRRRITAATPSPGKLATFLRHLEESGSVSFAARRTGIGRNTVYERRKADPAFARGWEMAAAMAVESLRDAAIVRARDGTGRALWRRGRRVGTIREDDTRLQIFLLRLLKPEVHGGGAGQHGRARFVSGKADSRRQFPDSRGIYRRAGVVLGAPERPGLPASSRGRE